MDSITIAIVEPSDQIRRLLVRLFREEGFRVVYNTGLFGDLLYKLKGRIEEPDICLVNEFVVKKVRVNLEKCYSFKVIVYDPDTKAYETLTRNIFDVYPQQQNIVDRWIDSIEKRCGRTF